ncbi:restriction endonuclease subunit S [Gordonia amicalis]|uniref:restriction endonuclease subunit S n=1 Tax=Gordonia TaxID=2053 RepID=UPI00177AD802|nr:MULTISPECIES: restriction endonuclease subunit S [Gordonia]UPW12537.1 restriction endonuclease subunit S [Gordonia amicalis]
MTTLGQLCREGGGFIRTGPFGSQLHRSDYTDDPEGIPVVMPKDMARGRIDTSTIARIDECTANRLKQHLLTANDVVLARRGDVGRTAWVFADDLPAFCGTGSMRVHPGASSTVRPAYLRFFFHTRLAFDYLEGHAVGATMPNLNAGIVERMPVPIPPLPIQDSLIAVLEAFDELIENNRRRVEVLEEMARTIYREWFVKFRYPGHETVPLVDSAVGPIPEGWTISPLAAHANIVMGQSPKSEFYNDDGIGRPFHQGVTDFGQHFPSTRKWCSVAGRAAAAGDILISVRAPVGRINIADTDITIGRGLSAIRAKDGRQALLLGHLREAFAEEDTMGNDGAIFKSLGKAELAAVPVIVPPDVVADAANAVLADNLDMIRALTQGAQRLSSLRDLLLPKLVTSQIDVTALDLDALVGDQVA